MVDLVAGALILLWGILGWRRGLVRALLPLVGVALACLTAWWLYEPVGLWLGRSLDLQPLISLPAGAALLFVGTNLVVGFGGAAVIRLVRARQRRDGVMSWLNRLGGCMVGQLHGAAMVLVLAWGMISLQSVLEAAGKSFGPPVRDSAVGRLALPLSERVARRVARGETGNSAVEATAVRLTRDPVGAARDLTQVLSHRKVQRVVGDHTALEALARQPDGPQAERLLRPVAQDKQLVRQLMRLGLVQPGKDGAPPDPQQARRDLARQLRPLARVATQLAADPEVQQLLAEPTLAKKLEQRDLLSLANDPRFNRLVVIVRDKLKNQPVQAGGKLGGAR